MTSTSPNIPSELFKKELEILELIKKENLSDEEIKILESNIVGISTDESQSIEKLDFKKSKSYVQNAFQKYYSENYLSKQYTLAVVDGNNKIVFKIDNFDAIINDKINKLNKTLDTLKNINL